MKIKDYRKIEEYRELKKDIRDRAKQFLKECNYNPDLVDSLDCYADRHIGFLAVYPDIDPNGLSHGMETLPIPLLYYYADEERFEITEAGKEYITKLY